MPSYGEDGLWLLPQTNGRSGTATISGGTLMLTIPFGITPSEQLLPATTAGPSFSIAAW